MIDFSEKTFEKILQNMKSRVNIDVDLRENAPTTVALRPASYEFKNVYEILDFVQKASNILFATGQDLDFKVLERGIVRKEATAATRLLKFNIEVPEGYRFTTIDGDNSIVYKTVETAIKPEDSEYYEAKAECETVGTIGNTYIGEILPLTNMSNLTYAYISDIVIPGTDTETDLSLRTRYLNTLGTKSFAGNITSYREYCLSQSGVGAVQVYPHWQGGGTVKCSVLDTEMNPVTQALIEIIQNKICPPETGNNEPSPLGFGLAPTDASVTITTADIREINVSLVLSLQAGYTVAQIRSDIENAINNYFREVKGTWGNELITNKVEYPVNIYRSQITANVLKVEGVLNVSNINLNNMPTDIALVENGERQEIPKMGIVSIINS